MPRVRWLLTAMAVLAATMASVPPAGSQAPLPGGPIHRVGPRGTAALDAGSIHQAGGSGVDFSNPPPTATSERAASFDPARSRPMDDETTPNRRSFANPDGTRTDVLTTLPTRFLDGGVWRDIDRRIKNGTDGELEATTAPASSPRLPRLANGPMTLATAAGNVVLCHPDARAVPARR